MMKWESDQVEDIQRKKNIKFFITTYYFHKVAPPGVSSPGFYSLCFNEGVTRPTVLTPLQRSSLVFFLALMGTVAAGPTVPTVSGVQGVGP